MFRDCLRNRVESDDFSNKIRIDLVHMNEYSLFGIS